MRPFQSRFSLCQCLHISSHSDFDVKLFGLQPPSITTPLLSTTRDRLPSMLRPNTTKIVITRDEIGHVGSKGPFPRYLYDDRLSVAPRSDGSIVNSAPNLHVARGLPFRTRARGISSLEASRSNLETSPSQAMRQASRRLHETPQQSPEASEGAGDFQNPLPFSRDVPSLMDTRYLTGPEKQQDVAYPMSNHPSRCVSAHC